jgi:hypothetical protein
MLSPYKRSMRRILPLLALLTFHARAQTPAPSLVSQAPVLPQVIQHAGASAPASPPLSRWRLSVGYAVRSFGAQFNMTAPSIGRLSPWLHGYGDVGLYSGSGALFYEEWRCNRLRSTPRHGLWAAAWVADWV